MKLMLVRLSLRWLRPERISKWLVVVAVAGAAACLAGEAPPAMALDASDPAVLQLGPPPERPADPSLLPAGKRTKVTTGAYSVNTDSREEVRSFYIGVYKAAMSVPNGSTANPAGCLAGTNAAAYLDATQCRINWFRAMAGVPAAVVFDGTFCNKAQLAALMMSANNQVSHTPSSSWSCYSEAGADAAGNSNLALGNAGPDAINGYMQDPAGNNTAVGHRRWLLYPQTRLMGAGDAPAQGAYSAANATWVFDGNFGGPRPATRRPFVSWPPAGFVPYPVVYPRWSFAYPDADFSSATVSMKSNNVPVTVQLETYAANYGENTLVWVPAGLDANNYLTTFPFSGADTPYTVTLSNVRISGVPTNFSYTVTVFDPAVPGADAHPPTISGPSQPGAKQNNFYTFTGVTNATGYQWRQTQRLPFNFSDNVESGLTHFTASTSAGYSPITNDLYASPTHCFHLMHADWPDQTLTLNHVVLPAANSSLTFKSRLGYATTTEYAKVQSSIDYGATWQDLYSQVGTNGLMESSFILRTVPLGSLAGKSTRLRFLYTVLRPGSIYYTVASYVGWLVDDVAISNGEEMATPVVTPATTTNFIFNPPQTGNYNLEARALIYNDFPLDWGPTLQVSAITNAVPIVVFLNRPTLNGTQVRIDFTLQSGAASTLQLWKADNATGPWGHDTGAALSTNTPGLSFRFTTSSTAGTRYYRVKAL